MKRRTCEIQAAGTTWKLQSVVPADFMDAAYWPFNIYQIEEFEEEATDMPDYFKQDPIARMYEGKGGLKPKGMEKEAADQETIILEMFKRAIVSPKVSDKKLLSDIEYDTIKDDKTLFNKLYSEIFKLSYGLKDDDLMLEEYPIKVSKAFMRQVYHLAHRSNMEPWLLLEDGTTSPPALLNPKRWDFNQMVLMVGADLDAELMKLKQGDEAGNGGHKQEGNTMVRA